MFGYLFSVDLLECTEINFFQTVEIKKIINNWNKQYLTPIGKITIIKTFILSKLNHLLHLLHIFYQCPNSIQLWKDIEKLLEERIRLSIKCLALMLCLGI